MISAKWRTLILLAIAELLGMSVWFSASAVVPALAREWSLDDAGRAWLTMSVQIGFVAGALGSALLNLADRIHSTRFFTICALLAAAVTAAIPWFAQGLGAALPLRFLTGVFLAGVYPVGMKIAATWTREDRGLAIGVLVGALTIGSASPHLVNALGGVAAWRPVLWVAAGMAVTGALLAAFFVHEGPFRTASPRFDWRYAGRIATERPLLLANLGYLGHMWELYAMWTWLPAFLAASFARRGVAPHWAAAAAFAAIAAGGLGCIATGSIADRFGRTRLCIVAMAISGACALGAGFLFGGPPWAVAVLAIVWGVSVIADSAQFSASVSELCEPQYTGTALTLQVSVGFLLTLVTIRLIPPLERLVGWEWAFASLAIGPALGIWAMDALRRSADAARLAGGRG
ncbi:MFS transporter [Verrucomicrobia bacterium SCGC AG-212-E04]|nr:MFS transporter [Verrucomicrobia bacterium SCGC AG-212-E04]